MAKGKIMTYITVKADVMEDPNFTLKEWLIRVQQLIDVYGENATMCTDAGYNNVTLVVSDPIDGKG